MPPLTADRTGNTSYIPAQQPDNTDVRKQTTAAESSGRAGQPLQLSGDNSISAEQPHQRHPAGSTMEQTLRTMVSRKPQAVADVENVVGTEQELAERFTSEEATAMLNKLMDALEKNGSSFRLPASFQTMAKALGWNETHWPCLSLSTSASRFRKHDQLKKLLQNPELEKEKQQYMESPMKFWKTFLVCSMMANIAGVVYGVGYAYLSKNELLARNAISQLASMLVHAKLINEYTSDSDDIEDFEKFGEYLMDSVDEEDKQDLMDRFSKLNKENDYSIFNKQSVPEYVMGLLNLVAVYLVVNGHLDSGSK